MSDDSELEAPIVMSSQRSTSITPVQLMFSSCTGAIITSVFMTPLDVVKIRLQTQQKEFFRNKCFLYCNGLMDHICYCNGNGNGNGKLNPNVNGIGRNAYHSNSYSFKWYQRPTHFNGTIDAFVKIARNEGLPSLWSGLPPTLVMAIPATVIYFTVYDKLRERLNIWFNHTEQPLWVPVVSGGSARTFVAVTISPLEMIRTKMQSKRLSYLEVGKAVKNLVEAEGILSVWRGLSATILRDVPFSCIYWANYEFLKQTFKAQNDPSFAFSFASGATAGTIAAIITLPFDVAKTHRQIEIGEMEISAQKSQRPPSATKDILKRIYKERGFRGLFTGIVPRIIKVAPSCAIMISSYEFGKTFFRQYNASKMGY